MRKILLILYLFIFVTSIQFVSLYSLVRKRKKYLSQNVLKSKNNYFQKFKFEKYLLKFPRILRIEEKLNSLDYPYNINAARYILYKVLITLFMILISIVQNNSIITTIIVSFVAFVLLDLLILLYEMNLKKEVISDLMNVTDSIFLQMSSNVSMQSIFNTLPSICNNKHFRKSIISMRNVYEYTGFNIYKAVQEIKDRYSMMETDMFCNALVEQVISGENLAIIENLESLLREKYILNMKNNTRKKVAYITAGICITLVNICAIVFYPIMNSFNQSFSNIFG